jgi:hypothetical protein
VSGGIVAPEHAEKLSPAARFDRMAAIVIGIIAVLGALLGVVHTDRSTASTRAQLQATRLATDISARIAVNSVGTNLSYQADEAVLMLQMDGADRALAAAAAENAGIAAVGGAEMDAAMALKAALAATQATNGGSPADAHVASMLAMTDGDFAAELTAQGDQMDLAHDAGTHDGFAVLGISVLALAAVLTGLAAVVRESRGGWWALRSAAGLVAVAVVLGAMALS